MFRTLLCTIAAAALAAALPHAADAQIKIGVIASATGPISVVGISQKNTAALLPKTMGGEPVEYIVLDDASDPTQTVQLVKKLLSEDKIDALIGPSGSPNAVGVIQFVAEAKTPMLAPVGTTAVVLPMDDVKRWVFKTTQNDALIASRAFRAVSLKRSDAVPSASKASMNGTSRFFVGTPRRVREASSDLTVHPFAASY